MDSPGGGGRFRSASSLSRLGTGGCPGLWGAEEEGRDASMDAQVAPKALRNFLAGPPPLIPHPFFRPANQRPRAHREGDWGKRRGLGAPEPRVSPWLSPPTAH